MTGAEVVVPVPNGKDAVDAAAVTSGALPLDAELVGGAVRPNCARIQASCSGVKGDAIAVRKLSSPVVLCSRTCARLRALLVRACVCVHPWAPPWGARCADQVPAVNYV